MNAETNPIAVTMFGCTQRGNILTMLPYTCGESTCFYKGEEGGCLHKLGLRSSIYLPHTKHVKTSAVVYGCATKALADSHFERVRSRTASCICTSQ